MAAAPPQLVEAEPDDEVFEIYDADCNLVGRELRARVHQQGLLHKATYCFVFDRQDRLLVQRRSLRKKIGPNQWDLSVAEHLAPGETHRAGGARHHAAGLMMIMLMMRRQPLSRPENSPGLRTSLASTAVQRLAAAAAQQLQGHSRPASLCAPPPQQASCGACRRSWALWARRSRSSRWHPCTCARSSSQVSAPAAAAVLLLLLLHLAAD
jgi:hypothetical protein